MAKGESFTQWFNMDVVRLIWGMTLMIGVSGVKMQELIALSPFE